MRNTFLVGLFLLVGFAVLSTSCPMAGATEGMQITLQPQKAFYNAGENQALTVTIQGTGTADVYLAVLTPEGKFNCLDAAFIFHSDNTVIPVASNWNLEPGTYTAVANLTGMKDGIYTWYAILCQPGSNPLDQQNWITFHSAIFGVGDTRTNNSTSNTNFIAVAAGNGHTIALKSDGTVWAWGSNEFGQLGDGTAINRENPVKVAGVSSVTSIAAGGEHSIVQKSGGTVYTWGSWEIGQLGDGRIKPKEPPVPPPDYADPNPVLVPSFSGDSLVGAGIQHSLTLKTDGTVWAWGNNDAGQLGDNTGGYKGAGGANSAVPTKVWSLSGVTALAAGEQHTLALKSDGTVWAWGNNEEGQIGDGPKTHRYVPVLVSALTNMKGIAAGKNHSLAIANDGTVWAWGSNSTGQLATTDTTGVPAVIGSLTSVKMVAAGEAHSVALKEDGSLWLWGDNQYGQLGIGSFDSQTLPTPLGGNASETPTDGGGSGDGGGGSGGTSGGNNPSSMPETVLIQPGTFVMGSPTSDTDAQSDEFPQHSVTISKAFYLGKYEVTNAQYAEFLNDGYGRCFNASMMIYYSSGKYYVFAGNEDFPVTYVSYDNAKTYCEWLTIRTGELYRLPTEAEWEYACRAGATSAYYWGDSIQSGMGDTSYPPSKIGTYPANAWGLYDMAGNQWEWCYDHYAKYTSEAQTDPSGPSEGSYFVLRSLSWNKEGKYLRSAQRSYDSAFNASSFYGFRVAKPGQ